MKTCYSWGLEDSVTITTNNVPKVFESIFILDIENQLI